MDGSVGSCSVEVIFLPFIWIGFVPSGFSSIACSICSLQLLFFCFELRMDIAIDFVAISLVPSSLLSCFMRVTLGFVIAGLISCMNLGQSFGPNCSSFSLCIYFYYFSFPFYRDPLHINYSLAC